MENMTDLDPDVVTMLRCRTCHQEQGGAGEGEKRVGRREWAVPQQVEVDERRTAPAQGPRGEGDEEHDPRHERGPDVGAREAPLPVGVAQPEQQGHDAGREQREA